MAPRRRDLRGVIDWRLDELARLRVSVALDTYVDATTLLEQAWEVVIVATGDMAGAPRVPGAEMVLDTWDVLARVRQAITASTYFDALAEAGVALTLLRRLHGVRRTDAGLEVELGVDGSKFREHRTFDAVVAEMGTGPVQEVYDELVDRSTNLGAVDLADLLSRRTEGNVRNDGGAFQLFRNGDAVASRNVHAAMLDAARLCHAI